MPTTRWWWRRARRAGWRRATCWWRRARRGSASWRACWATPTWTPPCVTPPSCSKQLPGSPKHDPVYRRGRRDPRAGDRLLDREPALHGRSQVGHGEPQAQPALRGSGIEHARGGREAEPPREIERVLRAQERVAVAPLGPITGRESRSEPARQPHERRYVHADARPLGVPEGRG